VVKMKKILIIIIGILLIGTVIAVGSIINKIIVVPEKPVGINGIITFNVENDKDLYECYVDEPDGLVDTDDIQRCARKLNISAGSKLSNICNWKGNCLKPDENYIGESLNK